MANNAKLYDPTTLIQAGIDPKTGLPSKVAGKFPCQLKEDEKRLLRIMDEQDAINRYTWYNLPNGLSGQMIERMLYYKYSLMFFYMESDDTFYCLPYALDGTIDVYGRFNSVTPLPFGGTAKTKEDAWIVGLTKKVVKEMPIFVEDTADLFFDGCVLIRDYTQQMGELATPRQILQDSLIDAMSDALPLARTNMFANCGVKAMRVNNESDQANVAAANASIDQAALNKQYFIPITAPAEFQDLTAGGSALKAQEFMVYLEALNNHRLSFLGIDNNGTYQKSAYVNSAQAGLSGGNNQLVLQDGLTQRQRACDFINAIWGLGVYVDVSEHLMGDVNMDGMLMDKQDQSGVPGEQSQEMMTDDDE